MEALNTAEHILSKMMEVIAGDTNASATGFDNDDDDDDDDDNSQYSRDSDVLDSHSVEAPNQQFNVRVKSKKYLKSYEATDEDVAGGVNNGDMLLDTIETTLGGKDGGGGGAGNVAATIDKDGGDHDNTHAVGGAGMASGGQGRLHQKLADITPDEDANKSRLTMKLALQKEQRSMEAEKRRKKLLERLESAKGDEEKPGNSRRKQQKEWATKMAVVHKVPTLPEGVTLRDDPMTKTIAFLKADPGLA